MVLSKTAGAKEPSDIVLFWEDFDTDGLLILQMSRLSPRQPSQWTYGEEGSIVGYNPIHGFSAGAGTVDAIETQATHNNSYINDYEMAFGGSYDWHVDLANEEFATGYRFEASNVMDVPQSDAPRVAVTNIRLESGSSELSRPYINGVYYEDEPERVYSGEDWELTGRYDASSLPPSSDEWTIFEEGRNCSAYLMKQILCENPNRINYRTQQAWSIPL